MTRVIDAPWRRFIAPLFYSIEDRADRRFDARVGIETCARAHADDLTISSSNTDFGDDEVIYVGLPVLAMRTIDRFAPNAPERHTFVDFGSGKGRALFYAARHRFKRVVGVEFAEELQATALANIETGRHPRQRCDRIESRYGDAVDLDIPDGPCMFFLFNPFEAEVMREVMQNIRRSYETERREMIIVYHNPKYADVVDAATGFERVWQRLDSHRSECYDAVVYRSA